jgi:FtsH-binding integral membrane protein
MSDSYVVRSMPVDEALPQERAVFIRKTYAHLAGAIGAFVGVEYLLFQTPLADVMMSFITASRYGWLAILGGFTAAGWLASGFAASGKSRGAQYFGLGLYVVADALIFLPLLYMAKEFSGPEVISSAALITGLLFTGLTAVVFFTKKDFSFMSSILTVGGFVALGLIIASVIFNFTLGVVFSGAMVILSGGAILYETSKIMKSYSTDQYVAASLQLFASVALMFWYVLRILMRISRR